MGGLENMQVNAVNAQRLCFSKQLCKAIIKYISLTFCYFPQSQPSNQAVITELVRMLKKKINDDSFEKFLAVLCETSQEFIASQLADQLSTRSVFNKRSDKLMIETDWGRDSQWHSRGSKDGDQTRRITSQCILGCQFQAFKNKQSNSGWRKFKSTYIQYNTQLTNYYCTNAALGGKSPEQIIITSKS